MTPADDARDNLMLQQLAWLSAPAGESGLGWLAVIVVITWVRAIVGNLLAWLVRHAMGTGSGRP